MASLYETLEVQHPEGPAGDVFDLVARNLAGRTMEARVWGSATES